jgi:hypothetical protein
MQRQDFEEMFRIVAPNPVTVRLLDPPMHEFLPSEAQLLDEIEALKEYRLAVKGRTTALSAMNALGQAQGADSGINEDHVNSIIAKKELMLKKVRDLHEVNPMLGHRGVRLGITYPEIYEMQLRAILEAEAGCLKAGIQVCPEIMVPQVITVQELKRVRASVDKVRAEVEAHYGIPLTFKFGTMIETVRACTRAGDLAELAEFFSFGTNDLTQAVYSFSREDAENKFLPLYTDTGILHDNPFETLDVKGVGVLMQMSVDLGRTTNPNLKVGICGEQGGDPSSIRFCHEVGINYVSCSPHRVPVARLAAAQALLQARGAVSSPAATAAVKSATSNAAAYPPAAQVPPATPAAARPAESLAPVTAPTPTPTPTPIISPPTPAPEPSIPAPQPIAASAPAPVETQAAIKILATEAPAGGRSKVQAYIDAMASGEASGSAAPATEAVGQPENTVEAAEPAVSQWESPSEPAAPAIQVQPGETRVAAMIRELSDTLAPAAVQPEARPAVTPQPEPVAAQPAPQAPAQPAKAEPKAAEGKTKGGFMGIMSKAFKALKDIDKPS